MLLKVFMANQISHLEWVESTEVHIGFCYKNKTLRKIYESDSLLM